MRELIYWLIYLCGDRFMEKEELIEVIRKLRSKLHFVIYEYEKVELKEATSIRIDYTEKIGQYECENYELYLYLEEIKYKIQRVQAHLNRGEKIDMEAIEEEVADILKAYYEKLSHMRINVAEMVGFNNGTEVGIDQIAKIKRIYRKLMKILHPDVLDPELGLDEGLWEKVQDAYKRNDLDTLIMIDDLVGETVLTPLEEKEESELIEMKERLELAIKRYEMKLVEIKKRFPFTEVEHLKNDSWIRARQNELKKSISEYKKSIIILEAALKKLLGRKKT